MNAKLKEYITKEQVTMYSCIVGLFKFLDYKSKQRFDKQKIGELRTLYIQGSNPSISKQITDIASPYASKLVIEHLNLSKKSQYQVEQDKDFITLTSNNGTYIIVDLMQCNCAFMKQYLLPCKHIFYCRRLNNVELFLPSMINNRWLSAENDTLKDLMPLHNSPVYLTDIHNIEKAAKKSN